MVGHAVRRHIELRDRYEKLWRSVNSDLKREVPNENERRDLFHDVLAASLMSRATFEERCSVETYLRRAVKNRATDALRRRTRERKRFIQLEHQDVANCDVRADGSDVERELSVRQAVGQLRGYKRECAEQFLESGGEMPTHWSGREGNKFRKRWERTKYPLRELLTGAS